MEDVQIQSWLTNGYNNSTSLILSNSSSLSSIYSSSSATTHSAPTLREDYSSFNSIGSISLNENYSTLSSKPSISHFCTASITATAAQISCLAVHDNRLYAATIKEINVFDLTTLALIETFGSGSGWAKSIAFSNNKIFTAHQDCKIRVWKQSSSSAKQKHQLISTLPTLKDRFCKCLVAKNYEKVRRHKQKLWIEHADAVSGLAVDDDLGQLYSVSWDKSFKTWKTSSDMRCVDSVTAAHSDAINAVAVNPSDKTVYTGCADGKIKVWAAADDGKRRVSKPITLSKHDSSVNAIVLTRGRRGGKGLISGGGDGVILVWERRPESGEDVDFFVACCLKGHRGAVLCLVIVNDFLISGSSDKSMRIWKYGKGLDLGGYCLAVMEGHCKPVKSLVAVAADGDLDEGFSVYSGSLDGEIRVWKVVVNSYNDSE